MTAKISNKKSKEPLAAESPVVSRFLRLLPKRYHDLLLDELSGAWAKDKELPQHFKKMRRGDKAKKSSRKKRDKTFRADF